MAVNIGESSMPTYCFRLRLPARAFHVIWLFICWFCFFGNDLWLVLRVGPIVGSILIALGPTGPTFSCVTSFA